MPIFPIVMDTTMISLVFKYFSLQIMYHLQIVKCICVDKGIIYSVCALFTLCIMVKYALKIASECTRNATDFRPGFF